MWNSQKNSRKKVFKLGVGLYLLLLLSSYLFIHFFPSSEYQPFTLFQTDSKEIILFFDDPLENLIDFNGNAFNEYSLISIPSVSKSFGYSYSEIARDAAKKIDSLNLKSIQIVGEGIGGSSAVQFAHQFPTLTKSISLIGANGVVELELLGGYHLNHAVYGAKFTFLKLVDLFIPHFGIFEGLNIRIERSRILYESDQRLVRDALKSIQVPVLIQHPNSSRIPKQVSEEYFRLLPQSSLKIYEVGDLAFTNDLKNFILTINEHNKIDQISESRLAQSFLPFDDKNSIKAEGRTLVILILVIILSTFISEDLTCIGTGLMIARGLIGFWPGTLACLFGIFFGDILLFLAGKWLASNTLHKAPLKWFINEKDIQKSYHWFKAKGPIIIIASRFIPGTRFPTYFSAGAIGASFWMFILYFGVASIIWTPALVGLAVLLGTQMISYFGLYQEFAIWVLVGVLSFAFILFKIIIPMFTFRGRRILVGKWKRIVSWEFWSPFIIYSFVLTYVFSLWIKYRSATICTLANPAIREGGFIKESKKEILDAIKATESVAKYTFISKEKSADKKLSIIEAFMDEYDLNFPIVIKPDVGERGRGVFIPKSIKELRFHLKSIFEDLIVQQFIEGEEFGVFYYRYPTEENGHIFSITKKEYLKLYGDGVHTLEELILKNPRAVCLAELHFDKHIDDLYEIPERGTEIKLVELGTHARGAIFYDGNEFITQDLKNEMDRISKSIEGFYFGRYDVKVPTQQELMNGENITVIELNGITSESTNIYDPKHSFINGIRTLMQQWKIAYSIGFEVKKNNPELKTPSLKYMLSLLR
ncbi:MAG: VTT domain-containing protein [Balneolaceae bacterium]